jgi:hypothetical protein
MDVITHKLPEREAERIQANREYKSLFGVPPIRDVQRLREATRESADL